MGHHGVNGMKRTRMKFDVGFYVAVGNRRSQAAQMTIAPGDHEGGPHNRHRGADQWLFVVAGSGVAIINDRRYALGAGTLLLIERGDRHEVRNTGAVDLKTLNIYLPPAYTKAARELPAAKG
jgi:mannose-6-phosphate isomerase-like protein (cupin superfamily)